MSGLNRPANPLKFDLAVVAKKNGLDAIHDTVHEMARDEARHGVALKGMLERYFKYGGRADGQTVQHRACRQTSKTRVIELRK